MSARLRRRPRGRRQTTVGSGRPGRHRRSKSTRHDLLYQWSTAICFCSPRQVALFAVRWRGFAPPLHWRRSPAGPGCPPAVSSCARCFSCRCAGVARRGGARHHRAAVPHVAPPVYGRRLRRALTSATDLWSRRCKGYTILLLPSSLSLSLSILSFG